MPSPETVIALLASYLTAFQVVQVQGHGRLMNPPARNAMWRFGYPNPVNFNDNELYCGGYGVQWSEKVGGKCGVCGDPWTDPKPRIHETGGVYANGLLGRRYSPGQTIDIEIELTTNHHGFFEVRLCPLNYPLMTESQECFNNYPLFLADTPTHRYEISQDTEYGKGAIFNYRLRLPKGVTCTHCIIQWIYYTGNSWGVCKNGTEGMGCGQQETFRNCADVAILTNTYGFGPHGVVTAPPKAVNDNPSVERLIDDEPWISVNAKEQLVVRSQVCLSRSQEKSKTDEWCMQNCLKYPPNCPEEDCHCLTSCDAFGKYENVSGASLHCQVNCLRYPPSERCPEWCRCS